MIFLLLGQLEDALVERQPAQLAVREAVLGQRLALDDDLRPVLGLLGDVLRDVRGELGVDRASRLRRLAVLGCLDRGALARRRGGGGGSGGREPAALVAVGVRARGGRTHGLHRGTVR